MSLFQIQKSAAASADELMSITNSIEELIQLYGKADWPVIDVKRRILQARCERLKEKLEGWKAEIGQRTADTKLSQEKQASVSLTNQLIDQNLAILMEKQSLLLKLEQHTDYIQEQRGINRTLETEIEAQRIRKNLQKILESEKEGKTT